MEPFPQEWLLKTLEDCIEYIIETEKILDLSITSASLIQGTSQTIENLIEKRKFSPEEEKVFKDTFKRNLEFSKKQKAKNYSSFYAQATVSLWGSLESLVNDFFASWILNEKSALNNETIKKIKINFYDYHHMTDEERGFYIAETLRRDLAIPLKQGCYGFEAMFKIFNLGGSIPSDLNKDLLELNNVRNLIVHKHSTVDSKFLKNCPWIKNYKSGDTFDIDNKKWHLYRRAVSKYISILMARIEHFYKAEPSK